MKYVSEVKGFNSGGNIMVYYGKLLNSDKFFVYGNDILSILNADYGETLTEDFVQDSFWWEKEHTIKNYETKDFDDYPYSTWLHGIVRETLESIYGNNKNGDKFLMTFPEASVVCDDGEFVSVILDNDKMDIIAFNKEWWETRKES